MRTNNDRITVTQAIALLLSNSIGVAILSLPNSAAKAADTDGWILVLLSGALMLGLSFIVGAFVKRYPEDTFVEVSQRVLGKILGYPLTFILILFFAVQTGFVARMFSAVMRAFMLPSTPTEFFVITLLLSSVYLIRHGIEPIARAGEILFPMLLIPIIILYLVLLPKSDFSQLLPVFTTPPKRMALGLIPMAQNFLGFEILLLVGPYIRSPERINWILFVTLSTVIALSLFITLVVFATIGVDDTKVMMWPAMTVIRSISNPGMLFERLDALALALWIIATFTTINSLYFTASLAVSHLIKAREFKAFVTMLFPWIYLVALFPESVLSLIPIPSYLGPIGLGIAILFPALVMLADVLKGKVKTQ